MKRFIVYIIVISIIIFTVLYISIQDQSNVRLVAYNTNNIELINQDVKNVVVKYNSFNSVLKEANIRLPLDDDFIPQGLTKVNEYIFITGYYENNNSVCYVLDKYGRIINKVDLNIKSHVGSIAYDSINKLIWIPDEDGLLNAYNVDDFYDKKTVTYKYQFTDLADELISYKDSTKNSISYLTIDNNYIYIGSFSINNNSIVKKYKIINKKGIKLEFVNKFTLPSKTQGITFINYNKKKYLITSNSFGRINTSRINIYEYKNNNEDYTVINNKYIDLPPMSEQIYFESNKLYVLFESGASKYLDGIDRIEYICMLDIESYLKGDNNEIDRL